MSVPGVVAAAVTFIVTGNPQAAMWAYTIASAVFPPPGPDGPRLQDLKAQGSEYGRPIPIVYGTIGIAGNVIWASDFVEEEGESGGKGGGGSSTFSYYGNMAVAVCDGERTIGRIWAGPEKRLIWDGATLEGEDSGALIRFYSGSETQLPDPLIESYEGVGSVEAFRGTCYLVLEHFPLLKDGNRLPFLTVEVGATTAAEAAAANLGIVNIQQVIITASYYIIFYYGSTRGFMIRSLADKTDLVQHHQYELADWSSAPNWFWDEDRQVLVRWGSGEMTFDTVDPATGVFVSHPITAHASAGPDPNTSIVFGLYYQGNYIFMANGSATKRSTAYLIDPDTFAAVATYTYDMDSTLRGPMFAPVSAGAYIWGCTTVSTIRKYPLSAAASSLAGPLAPSYSSALPSVAAIDPVNGFIWSATGGSSLTSVYVACTDPETATDEYSATVSIDSPDYFGWGANTGATPWVFYSSGADRFVSLCGGATLMNKVLGDYAITLDADTPVYVSQGLGTASGGNHLNTVVWNPTTSNLVGLRKSGYLSEATTATDPLTFPAKADSFYLGEADSGGVSTAHSQALSAIISDLSVRAGLTAGQIDVTALTDLVDGYAIANQTSVRDAITALMPAYFFDAVESDGKVKFVKRGGAIAVVIPDDDVGCFESGSDPLDPIETTRRMEVELPRTTNVRYLSYATDYSAASRQAKRLVGSSGEEQVLDLPLVLSDTKAQEIAEVNLHGAWVARLTYSFTLPRKYGYLEPTDIIVVYGYTMRLTKTINADGIIKCEATHDDSNVYVPNVVVTETPTNPGTVGTTAQTVLELA